MSIRFLGHRGRHADQRGFTLVEVLAMVSVATIGVLSTLVVANATITTSDTNEKRVAATNLAREGVELVRAARDSNWQARSRQLKLNPVPDPSQLQRWDCYAGDAAQQQAVTDPTRKPACSGPFGADSTSPTDVTNYVAHPNVQNGVPWFQRQPDEATEIKSDTYLICPIAGAADPVYRPAAGANCADDAQRFYRRVTVQRGKDLGSGDYSLLVKSYVTWPDWPNDPLVIEEYLTDWRKSG